MKKLDKNRNVTQEYLDYVSNLERQDLETFYIGADLLVDRLNNIINEFEKYLEETKGIYEEYTCAIKKLKELKGVDKE